MGRIRNHFKQLPYQLNQRFRYFHHVRRYNSVRLTIAELSNTFDEEYKDFESFLQKKMSEGQWIQDPREVNNVPSEDLKGNRAQRAQWGRAGQPPSGKKTDSANLNKKRELLLPNAPQ